MTSDLYSLWKHVCAQICRSCSRKQTSRRVLCLPPLHYVFSLEQQRVSPRGMCEGGVSSSGLSGTSALIPRRLFINRKHINISKNELLKHIFYLYRTFRINSDMCICSGSSYTCFCPSRCVMYSARIDAADLLPLAVFSVNNKDLVRVSILWWSAVGEQS